MVRRILTLTALAVLFPAIAGAQFIIVTNTGAQIPARRPPVVQKNLVKFQSMGGTTLVMNIVNLDVAETERINGVKLPVKVRTAPVAETAEMVNFGMEVPMSARAPASETYTNSDLKAIRSRRKLMAETGDQLPDLVVGAEAQRVERAEGEAANRSDWQTRSQAIKNRERELQRRRDILQSEANQLRRGMAGLDASRTQKLGAELDRKTNELDMVDRELTSLVTEKDRLRQEARRSGVPDDWIQ